MRVLRSVTPFFTRRLDLLLEQAQLIPHERADVGLRDMQVGVQRRIVVSI